MFLRVPFKPIDAVKKIILPMKLRMNSKKAEPQLEDAREGINEAMQGTEDAIDGMNQLKEKPDQLAGAQDQIQNEVVALLRKQLKVKNGLQME